MIGYIRLSLAVAVLLSHVGVTINGLNPGVISVVIFYMLAGGVVAHIYNDVLPEGRDKLFRFYKDRCLRIFPLYFYTVFLTLTFLLITSYGTPRFSLLALFNNALIIPINYYMVIESTILTQPAWNLIPPAWSLGTELQAYILLPFALKYKRFRITIVMASLLIYMAANLSYIHTDYFGYRLLPGVLFMFILGAKLREKSKNTSYWFSIGLLVIASITYLGIMYQQVLPHAYAQETLIGLIIGIPLLTIANDINIKIPYNKQAGALSYGVFLTHFLAIWLIDYCQLMVPSGLTYYLAVFALAVLIAKPGISLIERRVSKARMQTTKQVTS